jgi:hypothetical protein
MFIHPLVKGSSFAPRDSAGILTGFPAALNNLENWSYLEMKKPAGAGFLYDMFPGWPGISGGVLRSL